MKIFTALVSTCIFLNIEGPGIRAQCGGQEFGTPVFVGTGVFDSLDAFDRDVTEAGFDSIQYMTAEQMARKLRNVSGYFHPGFTQFAKIIGTFDPITGARTNDRPSLLSVMIIGKLVKDVGTRVVTREKFLDKNDRVVFADFDLLNSPTDPTLGELVNGICEKTFFRSCPDKIKNDATVRFRQVEQAISLDDALSDLLTYIYQNGVIYYF